jgi:putative protease
VPSFTLSGTIPINNGDGLCFFTPDGHLQGFRINRVDEQGRLYPADPAIFNLLRRGTPLFRNQDAAFERQLSRPTAERRIPVRWLLEDSMVATPPETSEGFRLTISTTAPHPVRASRFFPLSLEPARTPQTDNLRRQLLRLGDTPFSTTEADITLHLTDNWFIPASTLADWRRQLTEELLMNLTQQSPTERKLSSTQIHPAPLPHGQEPEKETPLMTCRYCLRQALGLCTKTPASSPTASPWFLRLSDGRRFPLRFDCKNCLMYVLAPDA